VLSNRSPWTHFLLVRCDSRHHGNIVLLGDAAYPAHCSIGSGTKLAMEDAIALSQAFVRHPGGVERALVDYKLESDSPWSSASSRRPVRAPPYFTRVERYTHMDPMPFAFNLLTRGRVTHADLAQLAAI
jgi:anthraniloyl-CoA monooxygenase